MTFISPKKLGRPRAGRHVTAFAAWMLAALTQGAQAQGLGAPSPAPVPEPSSWAAFAIGGVVLLLLATFAYKRRLAASLES